MYMQKLINKGIYLVLTTVMMRQLRTFPVPDTSQITDPSFLPTIKIVLSAKSQTLKFFADYCS